MAPYYDQVYIAIKKAEELASRRSPTLKDTSLYEAKWQILVCLIFQRHLDVKSNTVSLPLPKV